MSDLHIYNSLSRKKEKFESIQPGFVGIYVCGPTVYGHAHLGHAKSYISFDLIVRYLRYLGYKVRYVQNITDVGHLLGNANEGEDRIIKQAKLEKLEPMEIVETYTRSYFEDMDTLNVLRPNISPRASGHIPEQIELVETLIEKGFAYERDGNVYFDITKYAQYGRLSGRNIEELVAGARVDINEEKKHPADFALWKKADPQHLMQWISPWGKGYPGWHAECSVMSTKYLGQPFDIHGGGLENIFPHHECEIAQSEAAYGKKFANYWLHNNMVTIEGTKMGKSLGNSVTLKEISEKYEPLAIRFFILSSHYRSSLDFSDEALQAAQRGLQKIHQNYLRLLKINKRIEGQDQNFESRINHYIEQFDTEMNDDFNSPRAIAALFDFMRDLNIWLDHNKNPFSSTLEQAFKTLEKTVGEVLGLLPSRYDLPGGTSEHDTAAIINLLIDIRNRLRHEKNFQLADEIRTKLEALNIVIKDGPEGTTWEQKSTSNIK